MHFDMDGEMRLQILECKTKTELWKSSVDQPVAVEAKGLSQCFTLRPSIRTDK